ncbi:MAG: hypothetical protein NC408_08865 [Candidatus Gastranaerophilales bacterium]|nr:hypothetical protein [Candidatus Gastranaerophilales bacterium]MCM1073342.1 hypothetical protein [Bacteroides sp.]
MAIANLHETWLTYKQRVNTLNLEISNLQTQKTLATYSQADLQALLSSEKHSVRDYFKELWESDKELGEKYIDYTKIPDFEEAIDKIVAQYQDQLDEMAAWETALDTQITTNDTEKAECEAYMESITQMLSTNIQEDFNFGLNG